MRVKGSERLIASVGQTWESILSLMMLLSSHYSGTTHTAKKIDCRVIICYIIVIYPSFSGGINDYQHRLYQQSLSGRTIVVNVRLPENVKKVSIRVKG